MQKSVRRATLRQQEIEMAIFKRRNLFIDKYVNNHENRLYLYRWNWKDLNELLLSDSWLIL